MFPSLRVLASNDTAVTSIGFGFSNTGPGLFLRFKVHP